MNAPEESEVKPKDTASTPRADLEQMQLTQAYKETFNIEKMQAKIEDTRERLVKIETDNKWIGRILLAIASLGSATIAALLTALFSWLFNLD